MAIPAKSSAERSLEEVVEPLPCRRWRWSFFFSREIRDDDPSSSLMSWSESSFELPCPILCHRASVSEKSGICFGWSLREQSTPFSVQRGDKVDFGAFRNLDHNFMAFHCVNFAVQKCVWTLDNSFSNYYKVILL